MKNTVRMFLTPENVLWRMCEYINEQNYTGVMKYLITWENEITGQQETDVFCTEDHKIADAFWWGIVRHN